MGNIATELILVADESTITKAGKATFGVGWHYSGLLSKPVNSIQIITFSIVDAENYGKKLKPYNYGLSV